jgi:hypothetical protein
MTPVRSSSATIANCTLVDSKKLSEASKGTHKFVNMFHEINDNHCFFHV